MDGRQSISFTSFDSYNYPSHHNLTFHENQPTNSQYELAKDSTIRNFPGKNVNLGEHLEVMVLLQSAQIERLTINLQEYRMKFKRILNNERDYNSFKNQANELLQVKDELQMKNKRIFQFAQNQKGELFDQQKYVQILENKYRRALKLIEQAHLARQLTEQINSQLKQEIITLEKAFEAFKQKSIEEYQIIRQQLEKAKNQQLSFEISKFTNEKQRWGEILKRQQAKFAVQRQKYESLLQQQRGRMYVAANQIERLKQQINQNKQYFEGLELSLKKGEQEKENQFALMGSEIQRLNLVLKDKTAQLKATEGEMHQLSLKLNEKSEQAEGFKREQERYRHKNMLLQDEINKQNEEISKLSANGSALTSKIHQMSLLIQQKNAQIRLKDNKLAQQIQNYSQIISKSQIQFSKEVEDTRMTAISIAKELERSKKQSLLKEENFSKKQLQFEAKIKQIQAQKAELNMTLNRQIDKYKLLEVRYNQQNTKLIKDVESLRKRVEESYIERRTLEDTYRREQKQFMQRSSKVYEEKWEQLNQRYIQSNEKLKQALQSKQSLQKTVYSLKNSLEKSELQKEQIKKCRTFESMIKQIEALCQKSVEKQGQIIQLKKVITRLQGETRQVKKQIQQLEQLIVKLININNANESNRRQDNYLIIQQIKKLFIQHAIVIEQVKENTHKIAFNYNKHKEFLQSSQDHLLKSKELQIEDLKEKINLSSKQSQTKNQLKQIINKIIIITKQNTELKVSFNKKEIQFDQLNRELQNLKQELKRYSQLSRANIRDKEQICRKLMDQLQQSNCLLHEEKQNQVKLQSSLILLEEQKDKNSREAQTTASIINQLKNTISNKEDLVQQLSQRIEQMQKANYKIKEQLKDLRQAKINAEIMHKQNEQIIRQLNQRNENNQYNHRIKQSHNEKHTNQIIQKLNQTHEQATIQMSKLKNQINVLIAENNELKEEIIKTGGTILELTSSNQHMQHYELKYGNLLLECQGYKRQINQLIESLHQHEIIKYQYQNIKMESEFMKRQLQKHQKSSLGHSEKIQILQKQLHRMESLIEDFKMQNTQLQSSNYECSLTIQKNKIFQQKIMILNQEIDRLQKERMNFIEQLNICRLQISQDSGLDRQVKENQFLLVLLFAEIESIRQLLSKKDQEIDDLRKINLR